MDLPLALVGVAFVLFVIWAALRIAKARRAAPSQPSHSKGRRGAVAAPERRVDGRWVKPGETVTIGGGKVRGGLFYIGSSLPTQDSKRNENCLVDPALELGPPPGNQSGQGVAARPAYRELTAGARRGFVEWLGGGRSDPAAPVPYVLLYCYGLERRLMLEGADDDAALLVSEVERLAGIHGDRPPIQRFAERFLDAAAVMLGNLPERPAVMPDAQGTELSARLRAAIGRELAAGHRLDADWTLAWYLSHPETRLRTAATRCFDEFVPLFRRRFAERFPGGMEIQAPRRRLALTYTAASGSFKVPLRGKFEKWPDIVALTTPLGEIGVLVDNCAVDLEPLSRLLGRSPQARGSLEAALLLPPELGDAPAAAPLAALGAWLLERAPAEGTAAVAVEELAARFGLAVPPGRAAWAGACGALSRLGIGVEPDPTFGGAAPAAGTEVILFRPPPGSAPDPAKPAAVAARAQLEIGVLVSAADGTVSASELQLLADEIAANQALAAAERQRLSAHLAWLTANPPPARVLSRFRARSAEERRVIARIAVTAAAADGHLSVEEVRLLERAYTTLDLDRAELYRELQAFGAEAEAGPEASPALAVPSGAEAAATGFVLDRARLARIRQDTARVSAILTEVFAEESAEPTPAKAPEPTAPAEPVANAEVAAAAAPGPGFTGLEQRHARLLAKLRQADAIGRAEFGTWAREEGLLADGAIETINDWAFDRFGEPVLDDGEPIEVAHHLLAAGPADTALEAKA